MTPADEHQPGRLTIEVVAASALWFDDGTPVRAASGIAPFADGWLVAQDDATAAAWWRGDQVAALRLFPPVQGHDRFSEETGTKHLKPDLEAACAVVLDAQPATLLLGSGSLPARTRAALVTGDGRDQPRVHTADLGVLYDRVGAALEVPVARRNLEGACVVGDHLRWFQRGDARNGVPDGSVDVDLAALLAAITGDDVHPSEVPVGPVQRYDLSMLAGDVPLAITDAVALADGRLLAAAAAEDTPDPVADGVVSGAALLVLDGGAVTAAAAVPAGDDGAPHKVEGLALVRDGSDGLELLAVVDQDDPTLASPVLHLQVTGPR